MSTRRCNFWDTCEYNIYSVSRTKRSIIQRTLNKLLISARQPATAVSNRRKHRRRCTNGRGRVPSLPTNQRRSLPPFPVVGSRVRDRAFLRSTTQHRNSEWTQLLHLSCVGLDRGCSIRVRLWNFLKHIVDLFDLIWAGLFTSRRDVNSLLQTLRHPYAICTITMRSPLLPSFQTNVCFLSAHQLRASMALAVTAACRLQHLTPWPCRRYSLDDRGSDTADQVRRRLIPATLPRVQLQEIAKWLA